MEKWKESKLMLKKSTKGKVVTEAEHAAWHKKHGDCGNAKEHDTCMKKMGITIKKTKDPARKNK